MNLVERVGLVISCLCLAVSANAQTAPQTASNTLPIRLVVPFIQGELEDRLARLIVARSDGKSGRPLIVENRPGNTGHHGAEVISRARPDGTSVLFAPIAYYAAERALYQLHYDLSTDFAPITTICNDPLMLVIHPSLPTKSVNEIISLAKSQPGQISWGIHRQNELPELQVRMLRGLAGNVGDTPSFRDTDMALTSLLAGRITSIFESISVTLPHIRSGKLRAIATSGARPAAALPQVPTMAQSGFKGFEAEYWYALLAPEDTPSALISELRQEFVRAISDDTTRKELLSRGFEAGHNTPPELAKMIQAEVTRWSRVVKETPAKDR